MALPADTRPGGELLGSAGGFVAPLSWSQKYLLPFPSRYLFSVCAKQEILALLAKLGGSHQALKEVYPLSDWMSRTGVRVVEREDGCTKSGTLTALGMKSNFPLISGSYDRE